MPRPYHTPKSERDEIESALALSEALADLELAEIAWESTPENSSLTEYNRQALADSGAAYQAALERRRASRSVTFDEMGDLLSNKYPLADRLEKWEAMKKRYR